MVKITVFVCSEVVPYKHLTCYRIMFLYQTSVIIVMIFVCKFSVQIVFLVLVVVMQVHLSRDDLFNEYLYFLL